MKAELFSPVSNPFYLSAGADLVLLLLLLPVAPGPLWISFICATWGAVAAAFAGIRNEATFLALRFLLGIFEAGAFPGMVYYVSCFYPRNRTQVPMTGEAGCMSESCMNSALLLGMNS